MNTIPAASRTAAPKKRLREVRCMDVRLFREEGLRSIGCQGADQVGGPASERTISVHVTVDAAFDDFYAQPVSGAGKDIFDAYAIHRGLDVRQVDDECERVVALAVLFAGLKIGLAVEKSGVCGEFKTDVGTDVGKHVALGVSDGDRTIWKRLELGAAGKFFAHRFPREEDELLGVEPD